MAATCAKVREPHRPMKLIPSIAPLIIVNTLIILYELVLG